MNTSELQEIANKNQPIQSKTAERLRVIKNRKTEQNFCGAYTGIGIHLASSL